MTPITLEPPIYQIGDILFSPTSGAIKYSDETIVLRAREANLLTALIDTFPEVLSRGDIETRLWKDSYATNATINQTIKALRFTLKDDDRTLIRTIPKQGYVLSRIPKVLPIESIQHTEEETTTDKDKPTPRRHLPRHSLSSRSLLGLFSLFVISFLTGYWHEPRQIDDRISHQHNGHWFLSEDIPIEIKNHLTTNRSPTRYIFKSGEQYQSCYLIEEVMKCETEEY